MRMENKKNNSLISRGLSLESFKKINQHGIEYWGKRELQPLLGYSKMATI